MSTDDLAQGWTKRQALAAGALAFALPGGAYAQAAAPAASRRKLADEIAAYASDYDHLARVKEWSLAGGSDEEGE